MALDRVFLSGVRECPGLSTTAAVNGGAMQVHTGNSPKRERMQMQCTRRPWFVRSKTRQEAKGEIDEKLPEVLGGFVLKQSLKAFTHTHTHTYTHHTIRTHAHADTLTRTHTFSLTLTHSLTHTHTRKIDLQPSSASMSAARPC